MSSTAGSRPDESRWVYDLGGGGWGNQELQTYTSRAENAAAARWRARDHGAGRALHRQRRHRARLHVGAPEDQGSLRPDVRQVRSAAPGAARAGDLAGLLDAGRGHRRSRLAAVRRDRRHGEHRPRADDDPWDAARAGLFRRWRARCGRRRAPTASRLPTPSTCLPSSGSPARSAGTSTAVNTSAANHPICPRRARWVFDHDFFVLLNVAVGGAWPGNPDPTTTFPQEMKVDYVRVYRRTSRRAPSSRLT